MGVTSASVALSLGCSVSMVGAAEPVAAPSATAPVTAEALATMQQQLQDLSARLRQLEKGKADTEQAFSLGGYLEIFAGDQRNADAGGQRQRGFDAARLILQPTFTINRRMTAVCEVEFEHGGLASDGDDKAAGGVVVESAYLDVAVSEQLHWRLPGIDLVPFGVTNLHHEPTLFYSVQRPELAQGLIPTTWSAGSTSLLGTLAGSLSYQVQISTSLIDNGDDIRNTSEAHGVAANGYPAGFDGRSGCSLARPTKGDFKQQNNSLAITAHVEYEVDALPGLSGSTSIHYSPNVTPRDAYASDANGDRTTALGRCAVGMIDSALRYCPHADSDGVDLRLEAAAVWFSRPGQLRANNDGEYGNQVGRSMWGASAEAAWLMQPTQDEVHIVPFYRITHQVLQTGGAGGADAALISDGADEAQRRQQHTWGVAVFPAPSVVVKLDCQAACTGRLQHWQHQHVLCGVGVTF